MGGGDITEPLICKQCGAAINRSTMRCEYCGTQYKIENQLPIMVCVDRPQVQTLEAGLSVAREFVVAMSEKELHGYVNRNIAVKLAEALEPNIDYKVVDDAMLGQYIVKGRVRILPPGYKF